MQVSTIRVRRAPATGSRRAVAVGLVAAASLWLGPQEVRAQQTLPTPDTSGDQLVFIYDARTSRVPFLAIANPSDATLNLDVALYPANLSARLGGGVITLGPAANLVIDPTTDFGAVANGNAGLAVVTPVVSAQDLTPIVPAEPLVGSFTLANLQLRAGFGENPFGRLAVLGNGDRADAGEIVDGSSVRYERFTPSVLMVPVYFNPETLGPADQDGNRVLLASFVDQYGTPFGIGPRGSAATAVFFGAGGTFLTEQPVAIDGVLLSNLQAIAGGTTLSSSGKVFFDVDPGDGNVFGLFGQTLGTFAEGQRMPAVAVVPAGVTGPAPSPTSPGTGPTPTPAAGGACTRALVTVRVDFDAGVVVGAGRLEGLAVDVGYPAALGLPGTLGDPSVAERVMNLTGLSNALLGVADNDATPGQTVVNVGLVSIGTTIPSGTFASIDFDCQPGGSAPPPASFTCVPLGVNEFGLPITAESFDCSVTVTPR